MHSYTVLINENSHYMDKTHQYKHGDFDTCQAAITACKQIVDDFLRSSLQSPKSQESQDELWTLYTTFGDDPFILTTDADCRFSAWDYAKQRCQDLTQNNG